MDVQDLPGYFTPGKWTLERESNGDKSTFGPAEIGVVQVYANGVCVTFCGLYIFYPDSSSTIFGDGNQMCVKCTFSTGCYVRDRWTQVEVHDESKTTKAGAI
jgi:hypothetical protein